MSLFRTYLRVCSTRATMVGCPIVARAVLAHIMVGQPSCQVPGLFEAGPCAIAEQMGIPTDIVRAALEQLGELGLLASEDCSFVMRFPGVFGMLPSDDVSMRANRWISDIQASFPRHGIALLHLMELSETVASLRQRSMVYFIQVGCDGPIKIGRSISPLTRLATLQTGHSQILRLLVTTPGGDELEHALHEKLGLHRIRGEWFAPHADVLAQIAAYKVMKT